MYISNNHVETLCMIGKLNLPKSWYDHNKNVLPDRTEIRIADIEQDKFIFS